MIDVTALMVLFDGLWPMLSILVLASISRDHVRGSGNDSLSNNGFTLPKEQKHTINVSKAASGKDV